MKFKPFDLISFLKLPNVHLWIFCADAYEAEQLLKDVDIHSVTGILKLYLRELPEALFTDEFYPQFFEAFNSPDRDSRTAKLLQLFTQLPSLNHHIIEFLLNHMVM